MAFLVFSTKKKQMLLQVVFFTEHFRTDGCGIIRLKVVLAHLAIFKQSRTNGRRKEALQEYTCVVLF
jgi:hypothetical protein